MEISKFVLFLIVIFGLSGCMAGIYKKTYQKYAVLGAVAQNKGNWDGARRFYARAVINGELGDVPAKPLAIITYEYGRALGVTCFFELAEGELNRAYELDKKAGQPLYLSLNELARLNLDQGKYREAADYYARGISEMDTVDGENVGPIAYSDILDEYARSLFEIGDAGEASRISARSQKIRNNNPDGISITDRTPYGKFCTKRE